MENKKVKKDKENIKTIKTIKTIKIINYTDENIFGVKFSKRAKHIKCAIDYLTLNHLVDKNGMLKKNMYDKIRLRYIWQYLVYIRNHNKELSVFKKYLGTGYAIKAQKYFELIKLETSGNSKSHTMTKNELKLFIVKLFNLNKNLKIPFLDWYKNVAPIKREKPKPKKKRKYTKRKKVEPKEVKTETIMERTKETEIKLPNEIKTELKVITDKGVVTNAKDGNIKIKIKTNIVPNNTPTNTPANNTPTYTPANNTPTNTPANTPANNIKVSS